MQCGTNLDSDDGVGEVAGVGNTSTDTGTSTQVSCAVCEVDVANGMTSMTGASVEPAVVTFFNVGVTVTGASLVASASVAAMVDAAAAAEVIAAIGLVCDVVSNEVCCDRQTLTHLSH
jgi:hypothetical protein